MLIKYMFFYKGKYTFPKGTDIVIPIYTMGKNPKLFADPEKFQPERFLGEITTNEANPFTYIPFSAGPRNCKLCNYLHF